MDTNAKVVLLGDVSEGSILLPDLALLKTMKDGPTVINAFCKNCGSYHALKYPMAEEIFLSAKEPLSFEDKYLLFGSCNVCKGDSKTVEIKTF